MFGMVTVFILAVATLILVAQIARLIRWLRTDSTSGKETSPSPYGTRILVLGTNAGLEQVQAYIADWPSHHPTDASLAIASVEADRSVGVALYETSTGRLLWEGIIGELPPELSSAAAFQSIVEQVSTALGGTTLEPILAS